MDNSTLIALGSLLFAMIGGFWGVITYILGIIKVENVERRGVQEKLYMRDDVAKDVMNESLTEVKSTIRDTNDRLIRVETILYERTDRTK